MKKLIINYVNRSKRIAICSENKLEQIIYLNQENESIVGNIYIGTIERVLTGMNAAFVNIGLEQNGFLPLQKMAQFMQLTADEKKHPQVLSSCAFVGKKVLVQVEADATKTKGPKLTELYEINEKDLVFISQGNYHAISKKILDKELVATLRKWSNEVRGTDGILLRTSSEKVSIEELTIQLEKAKKESLQLQKKLASHKVGLVKSENSPVQLINELVKEYSVSEIIVDDIELKKELDPYFPTKLHMKTENIFSSFFIEEQLDKALKRVVWLENGAYLIIDELEALTIIDVNTGSFTGKNSLKETTFKTNEWALKASLEQMKLRNLSGMILIDFIEMTEKDKKKIEEEAIRLAKEDKTRVRVVGFTSLGILQLTRKKTAPSILEQTTIICPTCNGQARIKSSVEVAQELEREIFSRRNSDYEKIIISCSSDVEYQLVKKDPEWYAQFLQVIQKELIFEIESRSKPYYEIRRLI